MMKKYYFSSYPPYPKIMTYTVNFQIINFKITLSG